MEINDFLKGIEKLEKYYDKEYTEEQNKIMYDSLKKLSAKDFNRAVNVVMEKSRYLPKIVDFRTALAEPVNNVEEKPKIDFVKCSNCNGEGFVQYYRVKDNGGEKIRYGYVALCTCENGKKQREINGFMYPFINEIEKR